MGQIQDIEAAYARQPPRFAELTGDPARAAVGMLLDPRPDDVYVFFIHRAEHDQDPWSGHMGFPGGFREPVDRTIEDTVAREVEEEIGVDLSRSARLIGPLDEIQGIAFGRELPLVISPFLYVLTGPIEIRPNDEVQAILWVPLSFLQEERNQTIVEPSVRGQKVHLPAVVYKGKTIWGLTYRMLRDLIGRLGAV